MHSRIRIGFLAPWVFLLFTCFSAFAQTRPEPLPPLDSLDFSGMRQISGDLFGKAGNLEADLTRLDEKANEAFNYAQAKLEEAKGDSTILKSYLDSLSKAVKVAKLLVKKRSTQLNRANKAHLFTGAMTEMTDSLLLRKSIPKAWQQITQLHDELYPPTGSDNTDNESVATETPKSKKSKKKKESDPATDPDHPGEPSSDQPITAQPITRPKHFAVYNPAADVMLRPPTPPCVIAASSRDEFSGEISREMARAELFRYTNPALKTYLQGKTHVVCEAALGSAGTKATLILTFNINDPNARKAFGRLEKNSIASLKFLDGSTFELQNAIADDGVFTAENEASIFRGHYPLTPEALKKIRRTGLDKLRILWSKGYDDYDVQQVDLLMRQAECLFK
ncbi:MAG: hypothetical protein Q7T20_07125 [Saprospiraceae bacterium]|nr:hypothetical protein [Saprospiraceae bacterium]